jgi:predicted ATPase
LYKYQKMLNLIQVNQQVFEFLESKRQSGIQLYYTLRKSNYNDRLLEGYWFYGNNDYLSVSFWSGMDWKNRTPNISFVIQSSGRAFLDINVSDSEVKRNFVDEYLVNRLGLLSNGRRYFKEYSNDENQIIDSLELFIFGNGRTSDKQIIDISVSAFYENNTKLLNLEDIIYFINYTEFRSRLNKVNKYIKIRQNLIDNDIDSTLEDYTPHKPTRLTSLKIQDYGIISDITIDPIDISNKWIFITGENGSGKTNLMRAIATILGGRVFDRKEIWEKNNFRAQIELSYDKKTTGEIYYREGNEQVRHIRRPIVIGLAMYGPYRLDIVNEKISPTNFKKQLSKKDSFNSLFKNGIPLLNIDKQFSIWGTDKKEKSRFEKRKYYIKSIFTDIVPSLYNILFDVVEGEKTVTKYFIKGEENEIGIELLWSQLSTGTKSVFALVGDIMIRLFDQQRNIVDPSELKGIVIIDEIDLHLHPKAQKNLVINLSKAFPNVQFIVSTHSPIPLLGAPNESIFIRVERDLNQTTIERFEDKIPVKKLLPNALLGSPLFDLDDYAPVDKEINEILTQDNYEDALYHYLLRKRFIQFSTND